MKIVKISIRRPAAIMAMPASDSNAAVVNLPAPATNPAPLAKFPGKVPKVKFPENVLVKVEFVKVEDGVPLTNRRDGFPIMTRTSPAAIRQTFPMTSLLTK